MCYLSIIISQNSIFCKVLENAVDKGDLGECRVDHFFNYRAVCFAF